MLKSSLSGYNDAYIFVKGTITAVGAGSTKAARTTDGIDKQAKLLKFVLCLPTV